MRGVSRSIIYIKLTVLMLAIALACFGLFGIKSNKVGAASSGPSPSFTGAPAFGAIQAEENCTACHSDFSVNSGTGSVAVTGLPTNYRPGQTIPVTVTVSQVGAVTYGFELVALDKDGARAGVLSVTTPSRTQLVNGNVGGQQRQYIEHTLQGIIPQQFNFNTWTFNWQTPLNIKRGKLTLYAAGNATNSDGSTSGDHIYTTNASTYAGTAIGTFDGDGKTDIGVFRPSTGVWYYTKSSNGQFLAYQFGQNGDKIVPGDFDGDGSSDIAVWRPAGGLWFIFNQSNGTFTVTQFGASDDVPVVGDFDKDGKTDIAVWRPSGGLWFVMKSGSGNQVEVTQFGQVGDKPVPSDYDGDGQSDIAVFRPGNGAWYMLRSSTGQFIAFAFGLNGDKPVQGDYDGDGRTDAAVFRPSNTTWFVLKSSDGTFYGQPFGLSNDKLAPGDYDGDGKTDVAVLRDGVWFILNSSDGSVRFEFFGSAGDIPTSAGYIPEQ